MLLNKRFIILMPLLVASCGGKSAHLQSLENRLVDMQRSLDLMNKRQESVQNDIMVLQDQMETTRIQVQKVELGSVRQVAHKKKPSQPPIIEIRRIDTPTSVTSNKNSDDVLGLYRQAYQHYEERKLFEAQEKFTQFAKENPHHDYADNAIYWMGEIYYDQKEYLLSITEFKRIVSDYPNSNKMADAWLKIGMAYERLDDLKKAQLAYKNVSEQFPYTTAANKASERLTRIKVQ